MIESNISDLQHKIVSLKQQLYVAEAARDEARERLSNLVEHNTKACVEIVSLRRRLKLANNKIDALECQSR